MFPFLFVLFLIAVIPVFAAGVEVVEVVVGGAGFFLSSVQK